MGTTERARRAVTALAAHAADVLREGSVRRRLSAGLGAAPEQFDCAVFFADGPSRAYQIRQWLEPMARLSEKFPVAVLAQRTSTAANLAGECPLPLYLTRGVAQVEQFLDSYGVRIVFYVNNSQANFTILRQTNPMHIHLSHGESDKISMVSNQLKAYDYLFVAGEASRQRILANVQRFDEAKLVTIGRPQLDTAAAAPTRRDGRRTVLYAPTWEGDRSAMAYGSVASHGVAIARSVLADPTLRLIFRPHPSTGARLPAERRAVKEISALIARANKRDPSAGHYRDDRPDFTTVMGEADLCICDVSAMATDWLARLKPMLITRPVNPNAGTGFGGIAEAAPLLSAKDAGNTAGLVAELLSRPVPAGQLALVRHHFGDVTRGTGTRRFIGAVESLLTSRSLVD